MSSVSESDILSLAQELWRKAGAITIDEVDGAFYWHICRSELTSTLRKLVERLDELQEERHGEEFHTTVAELRAKGVSQEELKRAVSAMPWVQRQQAFWEHWYKIEQEFPGFAELMNKPPRMRSPLFDWYASHPPTIPCFQPGWTNKGTGIWFFLGIRDSQWRGKEVEQAIRDQVESAKTRNSEYLARSDQSRFMPGESLIFVDFKFYEAGELRIGSDSLDLLGDEKRWVEVESPVIMCTIACPLPPPGVIASLYDAIAIDHNQWNSRLYGAGVSRNQTNEVAIRTWAMGLLVGRGHSQRRADWLVTNLLGQPIVPSGFNSDRIELVKRVPEAERFVYQRRRPTRT